MIITVNGADHGIHSPLIESMHRLRAEVFADRLGWDVNVSNGLEIDRFDICDPLYILSVDDKNNLMGCLRLLPTTGPNMLRDVFSELLAPGEEIESPLIWESTRFCVSRSALSERTASRLNRTTGELLLGLFEVAQKVGLKYIVSVYDAHMRRILGIAGCHAELIGEPKRIGNVMTYAGLFEVGDAMISRLRAASGIRDSVLYPEDSRNVA